MVHLPAPGSFLWPQIALSVPAGLLAASLTRPRRPGRARPGRRRPEQRRQVKLERKARALAVRSSDNATTKANIAPLGVQPRRRPAPVLALGQVRGPARPRGPPARAGHRPERRRQEHLHRPPGVPRRRGRTGRSSPWTARAIGRSWLPSPTPTSPPGPTPPSTCSPISPWTAGAATPPPRSTGCSAAGHGASRPTTTSSRPPSPCGSPVRPPARPCSMADLVKRLDPPTLARLWAKHPAEAGLVKMLTPACRRLHAGGEPGRRHRRPAGRHPGHRRGRPDHRVAADHGQPGRRREPVPDPDGRRRPLGLGAQDRPAGVPGRGRVLCRHRRPGRRHPRHGAGPVVRGAVAAVRPVLRQPGRPRGRDRIVCAAATIALFACNTPDDLARLAGSRSRRPRPSCRPRMAAGRAGRR